MKRYRQHILYISLCLGLLIAPFCCSNIGAKDFVVVIDAGHGGHDPGAIGRISKEKNINLNVALKLGKQIQKNCPDVKVVYTRTRDVFIPLNRRAEIANDAKADLFISIHTNALANNRTAKGASTWTLGLAKSDANLEVAKRENSAFFTKATIRPAMQDLIPIPPSPTLSSSSCRINIYRKACTWHHLYKSISATPAAG